MGEVGLIGTIGTSKFEVGAVSQRDSSGNIPKRAGLERFGARTLKIDLDEALQAAFLWRFVRLSFDMWSTMI